MGKEWCEHIKRRDPNNQSPSKWHQFPDDDSVTYYGGYIIHDWDKFCSICASPRPKEQRKLSPEDLKAVEEVIKGISVVNIGYGDYVESCTVINELRERLG